MAGKEGIPHERCVQIGSLLIKHAEGVIDRWAEVAVLEQRHADPAYLKEMRNHLPEFVRTVGQEFCGRFAAAREGDTSARGHGLQRWRAGWRLDEVIRDYHILRRVVVEFLEEHDPSVPLTGIEVTALNVVLDLGTIAAAAAFVEHSKNELESVNQGLERKVDERTAQLRQLSLDLVKAEQREREKLARTLHDGLQQLLAAAKMHLAAHTMDNDGAQQELEQVRALLDESIDAARNLSVELAPPILFTEGLVRALEWLAGWMKNKHGLDVEIWADEGLTGPDIEKIRTFLYQLANELLFNVVKHSGVRRATLELRCRNAGHVWLIVSDEGKGFKRDDSEVGRSHGGWGLPMLSERVKAMGGRLEIGAGEHGGARVEVNVPIQPT